jgi:hypothetical protein
MRKVSRTAFVRLALIEGVVVLLGAGLLRLLVLAACLADPQLFAAGLQPPTE